MVQKTSAKKWDNGVFYPIHLKTMFESDKKTFAYELHNITGAILKVCL